MVYENIVKLCNAKNISIARLEKEVGLGNSTIRSWDKCSPTVDNIRRVAGFFGVTVDALISESREVVEDSE